MGIDLGFVRLFVALGGMHGKAEHMVHMEVCGESVKYPDGSPSYSARFFCLFGK